ncbi:PEP-CTERM system histidine kinase PrsK [Erythrobacter jejuensis]|uniref:histidine kinase n=2 Tax=Parerythrobacter jejuensis TaxID=795812 RepID=A0A845AUN4_9SPHN|nr:PEP-CTERM system histidine kinase PrsK [Parerythrobacter jejuensis]
MQVSVILHILGAVGCAAGAIWVAQRPVAKRSDRLPTIVALVLTGVWSGIVAAFGSFAEITSLAETWRNMAWLLVIYRLFANDGRDRSMVAVRPVVLALGFVECLQPVLVFLSREYAVTADLTAMFLQTSAMFRILLSIGALVLLHNLYVGASRSTRDVIRWSAAGIAGFWAFELNFYVVAYLGQQPSAEFAAMRGLMVAIMAVPLAAGASNGLAGRKLQASRTVAFQTLSLLVIGGYLIAMFGTAQLFSLWDGNIGRIAQVGFIVAAATVALLWLPSQRLRAHLRVTALKHLFQHRYDYREEWLRFTRTIGHAEEDVATLQQRVGKAMADITDSPAALLFLPGEDGRFEEGANWNWLHDAAGVETLPSELTAKLERENFVVELDRVRSANRADEMSEFVPVWLTGDERCWVVVPLLHFDRLVAVLVLARPPLARSLDWEDFDLLKIVARQLASYLAEHEGQQALMESAQFDDFNRRMAFVMHDIKNLASQLSLLARNAETHAENPEFRKDMLVTLRSSADKLNGMLARLGRYGSQSTVDLQPVDMVELGQRLSQRFSGEHPVSMTRLDPCTVLADQEGLEQALVHLVQNAIDTSTSEMPVYIDVSADGLNGRIDVVDTGDGMDAEFVRNRLFKPFVSSKTDGFGIGAFEAREMIRGMGGRVDVQSRPGLGTRFTIELPLAEAARFIAAQDNQEVA